MWILLALGAAVLWGVSYAARGRVIQDGLSPTVFFFYYAVFAALMAAAVIMTLPLVLAFLFAQRRFVEGIATTGLKG